MFLSPVFLWFLLLIPILIYLHMRKRHRTELVVSSLFLWTEIRGKVQTRLRRKLNENLHLLLQVFMVLLFALALSDPLIFLTALPAGKTVVVIDGSASMGVVENGISRFEKAKSEAVSLLRARQGSKTSVVFTASGSELISDFTESTEIQIGKIRELSFTHTEGDINGAVLLSSNLIEGHENSEIILISDGAFDSDSIKAQLDLPLTLVPIGNMTGNLGITAIQSRKDPVHPDTHHIFINVQNYTNLEVETELTLYINGDEYSRTKLLLPERGSVSPVQIVEGVAGRLEAEISSNDPFPLDDKAYMLLNPENPVSVLLITDGNFYLESLLSITEGIRLIVLNEQPLILDYDIVVFDKPPERVPGPGNYIFLGFVPTNFDIEPKGIVNFPDIKNWDPSHPIMANVDPRSFSVYQAVDTQAGEEFTSLLDGEIPLIYVHEESDFKTVYFTFRLKASDLFIRPAFPVLLMNTVKWLAPELNPGVFRSEQTGRLILQRDTDGRLSTDAMTGVLVDSEGEISKLTVQDGICSFFPEKTGFYNLRVFGKDYEYAVNLTSPLESDISRRFAVSSVNYRNDDPGIERIFPLRRLIILLILALMIYELILTGKKREGAGKTGKLQLGSAFLSIIFLIIVLSGVSVVKERVTTTVVFLLDVSRSISSEYRDSALDWINSSLPESGENINVGLVVFGGTAEVIRTPGPRPLDIKSISLPVSEVSNLEAGLSQSLALMPSSGDRRIVILSDGNETSGNILEAIRSLGNNGVRVSTVPLSGLSVSNEIIAHSITGPSRASPEEKISLTLEIESRIETTGNLFFYLDGEYYGEDIITIRSGRTLVSYKVNLKTPGYHLFEAIIESDDDTHFENNQFQKMVFIEGSPPVLYVHDGRGASEMLLGPLQNHGFTFDVISASIFPDTLSELFSYDSVILDNIPAYFFSISKMEMLRKAVAGGLGLLVIGGDNSLGAGGYYDTPLEKAIPIDVDITSSLDLPGTALVMVIDNSGSMQDAAGENERKSDLAKQAVYSALEVLEPGDTAGILAFDSKYSWIVKIEPELNMDTVRENLFPLSPGGGTVLLPALKEAYRVLDSTIASVKHILILSDGYTDAEGFKSLVGAIHKSGITVSTVAVGSTSNKKLMENIAAWGRGRSYYTDNIRSVPSIFVSESLKASKRLFVEETFFPSINQPHEILLDVDPAAIPPLHGFMLSYPKTNSEILLTGIGDNPLLSVWQYGIGRSAVFTSNLSGKWATDWYLWDSYKIIFSRVLRWISKGEPDAGLKLTLSRNRSTVYIEVDARDRIGNFLNGLRLSAQIILPDLKESKVNIHQEAAGYYQGSFSMSGEGSYFVTILENSTTGNSTSKMEKLKAAFISVPYPEEFRDIRPSEELLESVRFLTNGDDLSISNPLTSDFYTVDPDSMPAVTDNWRLYVIFGILFMMISIFLRLINPVTVFSPFVRLAAFLLKLTTGRTVITYKQFREKMNRVRFEEDKSRHGYSYWFGQEESAKDRNQVYMSKFRKK